MRIHTLICIGMLYALAACGSERSSSPPTSTPAPTFTATVISVPPTYTPIRQSPSLDTETEPIGRQSAQVINIVDGDTIDVIISGQEYRVRYILMDTPERGAPFFSEASEANRQLVGNKTVNLEKDVSETDRYGRLLRYVYLEDGTFVNAELVRRGYAQIATFPPDVTKEAEIRLAQQEARNAGRGLWATNVSMEDETSEFENHLDYLAAERWWELEIYTNARANLRAGPGTQYPIVETWNKGRRLLIIGQNEAGDWLQVDPGFWWIARFLTVGADDINWPVTNTSPIPPQPQPQPVEPQPQQPPAQNCDPSYPTVCIPRYPPDLDCGQISYRRFQVVGADPHGFDRDNDGVGCESG